MKLIVVNLLGNEGVGKSTISNMLKVTLGTKVAAVVQLSFADPLRRAVLADEEAQNIVAAELLKSQKAKQSGYRQKLLDKGAELRSNAPNYFVDKMRETIKCYTKLGQRIHPDFVLVIILDDCRFLSEFLMLDVAHGNRIIQLYNFLLLKNAATAEDGAESFGYQLQEIIETLTLEEANSDLYEIIRVDTYGPVESIVQTALKIDRIVSRGSCLATKFELDSEPEH